LAGLVSFRVKAVFGEEIGRRALIRICVGRSSGYGHTPIQLIEDIGTELEKLDAGQALQLVAGSIRRGIRFAISRRVGEKSLQRHIMLAQYRLGVLVPLAPRAVSPPI
jgi:hypothetical protein